MWQIEEPLAHPRQRPSGRGTEPVMPDQERLERGRAHVSKGLTPSDLGAQLSHMAVEGGAQPGGLSELGQSLVVRERRQLGVGPRAEIARTRPL